MSPGQAGTNLACALAILAVMLSLGCKGHRVTPMRASTDVPAALAIEIEDANNHPVTWAVVGQFVQLKVAITNTSEKALWVNERMNLNAPRTAADKREVWLKIIGPNGLLEIVGGDDVNPPRKEDYRELRPGESVYRRESLEEFDLSAPGRYTVTAWYQDGNIPVCLSDPYINWCVPPAPAGATHLDAILQSNTAAFTVVQPSR